MVLTWFFTFRAFAQCPDNGEFVAMAPPDGKYCASPGVTINILNSEGGVTYQLKLGTTVVDNIIGISGNIISFAPQFAGTYDVYRGSCSSPFSTQTIVYENPVTATFVGFPEFCPTFPPPTFTASPSGGTYQWYRNGNSISGATSINYTPTQSGTYKVSVAKNGCADMSGEQTMIDATQYTPSVSVAIDGGGSSTICEGTSVTFKATPTTGGTSPTYQWKKNGNNVGTNNKFFTPNNLNTGDQIKVKMTSNYTKCLTTTGQVTSNIITMGVNPNPDDFAVYGGSSYCYGGNGVDLKVLASQNGVNYRITVNGNPIGNTKTGNGGDLNFGKHLEGTYSAIATLNACTTTSWATVNVVEKDPVGASFVGFPEFCPCQPPPTFTASHSGGSYYWYLNGNPINGETSKTFVPDQAGTYKVLVTKDGCSEMSGPQTMIDATLFPPSMAISFLQGSSAICEGDTVIFQANPTNGGTNPSYQWKKNGANVGNNSPTFSSWDLSLGNVITCEMTSNLNECMVTNVASASVTMTVNEVVEFGYLIEGNGTYCAGGQGLEITLGNSAGGATYQLKKGGVYIGGPINSLGGPLTFGFHTQGTYTVTATAEFGGCTTESPNYVVITEISFVPIVNVDPNSLLEFCEYNPPVLTAIPNGGTGYQWILNGSGISGATGVNHTTDQAGDYSVMVTKDGCTYTSQAFTLIDASEVVTPSVTVAIIAGDSLICEGELVTFEATSTEGGLPPLYQWKLNGSPITGETGSTYSSTSLDDQDQVSVTMTSTASKCLTSPTAEANAITMEVHPNPTAFSVSGNLDVCYGKTTTLTSSGAGGASVVWSDQGTGEIFKVGDDYETPPLTTPGTINLKAQAVTAFNCSEEQTLQINVQAQETHAPDIPTVTKTSYGNYQLALPNQTSGYQYFWQNTTTGTSENDSYSGPKSTGQPGFYFIRSKKSSTGCWGTTVSAEIPDLLPQTLASGLTSSTTNQIHVFNFLVKEDDLQGGAGADPDMEPVENVQKVNQVMDGLGRQTV